MGCCGAAGPVGCLVQRGVTANASLPHSCGLEPGYTSALQGRPPPSIATTLYSEEHQRHTAGYATVTSHHGTAVRDPPTAASHGPQPAAAARVAPTPQRPPPDCYSTSGDGVQAEYQGLQSWEQDCGWGPPPPAPAIPSALFPAVPAPPARSQGHARSCARPAAAAYQPLPPLAPLPVSDPLPPAAVEEEQVAPWLASTRKPSSTSPAGGAGGAFAAGGGGGDPSPVGETGGEEQDLQDLLTQLGVA